MAAVVAALDHYTPKRIGENGQEEYDWSHDENEKIVQLFFQLNRCSKENMIELATQYKNLLDPAIRNKNDEMVMILSKLVAQTRDLVDGKGEYALSWHLLNVLDQLGLDNVCCSLIYYFVHDIDDEEVTNKHPLGSWRDIKYLWSSFTWSEITSNYMINLVNEQVYKDYESVLRGNGESISLVGKWAPREKSQFSKFFKALANNYFQHYIETAEGARNYNKSRIDRASRKAYTDYRKVLSKLNRYLDTTQIKQCEGNYCSINYDNVTSVTLNKQRYAFKNQNKDGTTKHPYNQDRILAANQYTSWIANKIKNNETIKGSRIGVNDMVKSAVELKHSANDDLKSQLNSQWADGNKTIGMLKNCVAMCDVSGSMMTDEAFNAAVGLSLRISDNSNIGKGRVMTFTNKPSWIKLGTGKHDFVDNVYKIVNSNPGYNTNFTAALELLLEACVAANCSSEEVGSMVLIILSDMQIDYPGNEPLNDSMWSLIEEKFASKGYNKIPHILFWNLRVTNGFPTLSTQRGASMFSGYSPALLNLFCNKGTKFLEDVTPFKMMLELLNNNRYKKCCLDNHTVTFQTIFD